MAEESQKVFERMSEVGNRVAGIGAVVMAVILLGAVAAGGDPVAPATAYSCTATVSGDDVVVAVTPSPGVEMNFVAEFGGGSRTNAQPSVGPVTVAAPGDGTTFPGLVAPRPNLLAQSWTVVAYSTAKDLSGSPVAFAKCFVPADFNEPALVVNFTSSGPGMPAPGEGSAGPVSFHLTCGAVDADYSGGGAMEVGFGPIPFDTPCTVTGNPYPGATEITYQSESSRLVDGQVVVERLGCRGFVDDVFQDDPYFCLSDNTVQFAAGGGRAVANLNINWYFPEPTEPRFTG